jgi:hypothetical protein
MFAGLLIWGSDSDKIRLLQGNVKSPGCVQGIYVTLLTVYGTSSPAWSTLAKLLTYNQIYPLF